MDSEREKDTGERIKARGCATVETAAVAAADEIDAEGEEERDANSLRD